jgi:1-acyl-sn-glycerol-3-phosphate acyltransferase
MVLLFPEGTRTADGRIGPLLPFFAAIAAHARAPVVPAVVRGAFEAWPRGRAWPRPHPLTVAYGRPIGAPRTRGEERALVARVAEAMAALECDLIARGR